MSDKYGCLLENFKNAEFSKALMTLEVV